MHDRLRDVCVHMHDRLRDVRVRMCNSLCNVCVRMRDGLCDAYVHICDGLYNSAYAYMIRKSGVRVRCVCVCARCLHGQAMRAGIGRMCAF